MSLVSHLRQTLRKNNTAIHVYRLIKIICLDPLNAGKRWHFIKRYLWWYLWAMPRNKQTEVRLQNGMITRVFADSDSGHSNLFTRNVDYYDTLFIRSVLKQGDFIVDAGCNVGNRTLVLADMLGGGLLLDANPQCLQRAQANFQRNHLNMHDFYFQAEAVGAEKGVLYFSDLGGTHCSNHILTETDAKTQKGLAVPVTTIDGALAALGNPPCHFLKFDLEGFDLEGLKGAEKTLRSGQVKLVEFERWASVPLEPFLTFFEALNWKVFALNEQGLPSFESHFLQTNRNLFAMSESALHSYLKRKQLHLQQA